MILNLIIVKKKNKIVCTLNLYLWPKIYMHANTNTHIFHIKNIT
jgi:hypothetical protein